jgi:hypothetical protein
MIRPKKTLQNSITQSFSEPKTADSDSEFVYLRLTVTNSSHERQSFIPQNNLKSSSAITASMPKTSTLV